MKNREKADALRLDSHNWEPIQLSPNVWGAKIPKAQPMTWTTGTDNTNTFTSSASITYSPTIVQDTGTCTVTTYEPDTSNNFFYYPNVKVY
jgi:hypothetical protein